MTFRFRGMTSAWLIATALALSVSGCQSTSLPLFSKDEKPADASAQTAATTPADAQAKPATENTTEQAAATGEPQADQDAPSEQADAAANQGQGDLVQSSGGQGSLSALASNSDDPGPGVQRINTKGGVGASLSRRLNKMLGRGNVATPSTGPQIEESEVAGVWTLDEEDGLRVCTVTMSDDAGNQVLRGPNCSGFVENVASWGLFGPELQFRDASNTVLARLRQSGEGWVGFTVSTGVPLLLSRG